MKPLYVAYDDHCRLCMRFARVVAWLDRHRRIKTDSAHHPRHEKLQAAPDRLSALVAWDSQGERYLRGFAAVAAIVRRLPGAVVFAPALHLLERSGWGEHLYTKVALRRHCTRG